MNRIFTITAGRSGIHWLAAFFGVTTRLQNPSKPEYFPANTPEEESKRNEIVDKIWSKIPENYVNVSLLAKNGYLDQLAKNGARFIYLKRKIKDNANSWYRMDGIPGRTARGTAYHPHPWADDNKIDIKSVHKELTDYQLCLWLCLEARERAELLGSLGVPVYMIDLYDISVSPVLAVELLEWSGLKYTMDWWGLVFGTKINELIHIPNLREELPIEDRIIQERDLYSELRLDGK